MTIEKIKIETANQQSTCNVKIYNCGTGEVLDGCFKGETLTAYQLKNGGCNLTKLKFLEEDQEDQEDQEDWQAAIEEFQEGFSNFDF